jgi:hypothetical protein
MKAVHILQFEQKFYFINTATCIVCDYRHGMYWWMGFIDHLHHSELQLQRMANLHF